jgi:predicted dehydrogenase
MIMNDITNPEPQPKPGAMSRKDFLSLTGKTLAAGAVAGIAAACATPATASADKAISPPARIPASPTAPIVLEEWKSENDVKSAPTPTPLPPDQRVGYAVVGLGHLSLEELLPALNMCKKSRLAALVSGSAEKMEKVAKQYGIKPENCYSYETYDKLKDNREVDVIYIVLPNGLHKEYVIRGAKTGKHILCEKPMANTAAECREMIAACNAANVKLMIAYRIQYQPHNRKIKEMLQQKEFGATKFLQATNCQASANPDHWRHKKALAGGGALPDIGIYCINTNRFILGQEPTEVFAYQYSTPGDPLFTEVEEMVSWQMKFPNGVIASCVTNYDAHDNKSYDVFCEKGWYKLDNAYAYKGQKLNKANAEGKVKKIEDVVISETNQFAVEMDHFSDCVINNKRPYSTGEEGLQDHIIMEAIYESARTGRPVAVPKAVDPSLLHGPEPELGS